MKAFSDFEKREDFLAIFRGEIQEYLLTPGTETTPLEPTPTLTEVLERASLSRLRSEQSLREALIYPILIEIVRYFKDKITFFSSIEWTVNQNGNAANEGLTGFCDYIIGGRPKMYAPKAPMICVVEAIKQDFDGGTWQCAAELYACKIANEQDGTPYAFYLGCVTTGQTWNFLKLDVENNTLIHDEFYYALNNLPQLLGVWYWALSQQLAAERPNNKI